MIEPGRLMRAIWLQAQPIDRGYLVSGGRDRHMVEVDGGRCFCNCPDAQARDGDSCKHALLVRLLSGDPDVVRAPVLEDEDVIQWLVALSVLTVAMRSAVERDGYTREITLVPATEAPPRLAITLKQMLFAARSIGLDEPAARDLVRKLALDSTPVIRHQAFALLADAPSLSTRVVAETLNYPTSTTRRALEDLNAHRLVTRKEGAGNQGDQWAATSEALRLWDLCRPPRDPDQEAQLAMQEGA